MSESVGYAAHVITLRDYQTEAADAVDAAHARGVKRPAVVLPTGVGKTVVFSEIIRRRLALSRDRVLVLAHREELIDQAVGKIRAVSPDVRVGVVKAERDNVNARVVVASVQTLRSERRRQAIRDVGLLVIDEAHHASADSYQRVLEHYGCFDDGADAVGFTATMARGDRLALGDTWQDVVYKRDIAHMIRDGHLCGVRGVRVYVPDLDLAKVRRSRGDYSEKHLGEALEGSLAPEKVAEAYREHAAGLQGLLFGPTVSSVEAMAAALAAEGISVDVVTGEMASGDRRAALQRFRDGTTQVLANCMVLTEGTDLPMATVCVVARPTTNQALYVQMVGRVLRPYPGKDKALVLDITGASQRHALVSPVDLFGEESRAPTDASVIDWEDEREPDECDSVPEQVYLTGDLESVEVDLFGESKVQWHRTGAGIWFIATLERYIALIPLPYGAGWDVVAMHKNRVGMSRFVIQGVTDLGFAMAHAEGDITQPERVIADRGRSWRVKPPSPAMRGLAASLGIAVPERGMHGGELSGLITVALGTRRIDPCLPRHAALVAAYA